MTYNLWNVHRSTKTQEVYRQVVTLAINRLFITAWIIY